MLTKLFFVIFTVLLLGCGQQETELTLGEDGPSASEDLIVLPTVIDEETGKPLNLIQPSDVLKIYVRNDGAPGMYLGENGELMGFYVELEKMLMQEMGQAYELIGYDNVGPVAQLIKSGEGHSALAVPDLPDYRSFLNLSMPFEYLHYVTFVQSENTEIHGETSEEIIKSLFGKKVGVQTRGHIFQTLRDYKEIELVEYPTTTKALEALAMGLLDAVPDVERIGIHYSLANDWDIKVVGEPIITHLDTTGFSQTLHPNIVERYNAALEVVRADGRFRALYENHYGPVKPGDLPE